MLPEAASLELVMRARSLLPYALLVIARGRDGVAPFPGFHPPPQGATTLVASFQSTGPITFTRVSISTAGEPGFRFTR